MLYPAASIFIETEIQLDQTLENSMSICPVQSVPRGKTCLKLLVIGNCI